MSAMPAVMLAPLSSRYFAPEPLIPTGRARSAPFCTRRIFDSMSGSSARRSVGSRFFAPPYAVALNTMSSMSHVSTVPS